jgi:hypothetical protein
MQDLEREQIFNVERGQCGVASCECEGMWDGEYYSTYWTTWQREWMKCILHAIQRQWNTTQNHDFLEGSSWLRWLNWLKGVSILTTCLGHERPMIVLVGNLNWNDNFDYASIWIFNQMGPWKENGNQNGHGLVKLAMLNCHHGILVHVFKNTTSTFSTLSYWNIFLNL